MRDPVPSEAPPSGDTTTADPARPDRGEHSPRGRATWRPVAIFAGSRAIVFATVACTAAATGRSVTQILTSWDSKWYLEIARSGYVHAIPPGQGNAAQSDLGFFPLLPLVIRAAHALSGLSWSGAGILVTSLTGLGAAIAIWWLLADLVGARGADRGTALVALSPGAFVFSLIYGEGLFVLLVACCLLALRRRKWLVAGLCAGLATATDPVAIAIVVPCVLAAYEAIAARREWRSLLAPLLAPVGIVAFFSYLWAHTGTPLEWLHAQRAGWQGGYLFSAVPKAIAGVFTTGVSDLNPVVKTATFLAAIVVVVLFVRWRPPRTWTAYVVSVLFLGIMSPIVGVTPRLLSRDAPLVGYVGAKLSPRVFAWALGVSAACCVFLTVVTGTGRFTP